MTKEEIQLCFKELNDALEVKNIKGELCLYGGTVMCVVYNARPNTKDVDAVFEPASVIREVAKKIAAAHQLREDWLNDAVKGYVVPHPQKILFNWSHLKVYYPEPDYLLAMKVLAARVDTLDRQDVQFLIQKMNLKTATQVLNIVEKYYPKQHIKPATQFFVEEMFENDAHC